jgi:tetratricopeptide (TPR) repeat protein
VVQTRESSRTPRTSIGLVGAFVALIVAYSNAAVQAQSSADNEGWRPPPAATPTPRSEAPRPAAGGSESDRQAAASLFDAGTIAFRQQRFEDALGNFQQAYKLTREPTLLFNIGLTFERLYRLPEAIRALEDYLAAWPDAPNRPAAEDRIRVMRVQVKSEEEERGPSTGGAGEQPPPPPPPPTPVDKGTHVLPSWAFWTGLGGTAVLGGVTIWSGVDTLSTKDDYDRNPTSKLKDEGQRAELRTNVLIASTGVLAAATAVIGIFFTDWDGAEPTTETRQARLTPWLDRTSAGVSASGSF